MPTTPIHPNDRLGEIAASHPAAVQVFLEHDLDFCCGGRQTLADACQDASLDTEQLIRELRDVNSAPAVESNVSWSDRPLTELIQHIITVYHEPLREKLPHLKELARRVEQAHGPDQGPRLSVLRNTVDALAADLLQHLEDEEQRLFPHIRRGDVAELNETVDSLVNDHVTVAGVLTEIRGLTGNFTLPEHACTTWQAFWWNLQELERELKQHIHLENNVLFPRALPHG